jgi:hypothetical protein
MELLLLITGALLASWLTLTVVVNIPPLSTKLLSLFPLGRWTSVVPSWGFFAPNPAKSDHALLYRDRFDSGDLSPWQEVPFLSGQPRSILTAVWNPKSRPRKALSDAAAHLAAIVRDSGKTETGLILSVPYLLILNRISHIPRGPGVTGRQFLVVLHSITQADPEVFIVSNIHDL